MESDELNSEVGGETRYGRGLLICSIPIQSGRVLLNTALETLGEGGGKEEEAGRRRRRMEGGGGGGRGGREELRLTFPSPVWRYLMSCSMKQET